ncbi:blast:Microtubule-associated protein futsch [Drosophila guanche]|nr:blast:Microtubule-associated protein futsch [Drosophila guanche]
MASKDSMITENMKNERQINNEATAKRLIRLYRANQCLWNHKSPGYHCMPLKHSAWDRITRILNNGLTPDQVKLQVLSLRTYYDMESQAIKRSKREGFHYVPCRSIFNDLQFLADQEPCEAEQSKSRPSVRDDQVQCIIDDVTEMMNKDCAECRHSLRVDFNIPIGERSASSNMSFVDKELDNSSVYDSDLETLPTTLPRATSGADRYHHQKDEEESSDYSYHHQLRQQAFQCRSAGEAGYHRYSRPTENYSHSCHYGHRIQHTTYVSVDDEASASAGRAPKRQLQVHAPRPRSGMEAGSNYDCQHSRDSPFCRRTPSEEACNVLLLKFNPRNAKNNKVICANRPANYREPATYNASEQELQSAETPVYEDSEHRALPADEHADCRYNPTAHYTQNPPQNEQAECFYYPEGADPYEYLECYCPPDQEMSAADQLYHQEDDANEELPVPRRPQSQFYECGNTAPVAYRSRQCARPREEFNPNRFERMPQTHPQYVLGSCSKDTTTMTVPKVESWDSRNSGPDSYVAQQCAAVAEKIMKDYRIRNFKCPHQKHSNNDRDYCDEPVARPPQRHYQTEDGEYVECPGRRKEVEREASPARHRASTSSKVPKAREYKFPQQYFLASLKSDNSDQGGKTPNQYSEKCTQDRYEYDDRECVKDCPRISRTKDCRGDKFPSTCLSALNDYNSEEDGQDKYYQKTSPASSPYEDYEADDEQSPKQFSQLRSSQREESARSPPQTPRRRDPHPSHRYEECNDDTCPSPNRIVTEVAPRQCLRRTSDRGQYSEPLASQQQRRRSDEVNGLQTYPEECCPSSKRKQQQKVRNNGHVEYLECPKRGLRPRSDNAEHEDPRNMEATEEPSMGNISPPNSPNDSQRLSEPNSNRMYISQEELRDEDDDGCRCELEPMVPESTSPTRSMQNDRPDGQMASEISPEIDPEIVDSREDSQAEPTAPEIASSKKNRSHDFLRIPSSKRNSRDYQPKEPSPIQTPQRELHHQEDPVENPTHSQEFEELISCNDGTCAYANLNVPETTSSMGNNQEESQLRPTPTQTEIYRDQEKQMDLLEIAECVCEDEPIDPESTAAERTGQNDGQEEPTGPEIASSKRDSRQEEPSAPGILSSKRRSRDDRREKRTAPSSKRASRNSRRNEPILDYVDECRCEVELNVPQNTSNKSRRRNDHPDDRMLQKNAQEKRISRQEEHRAPEITASQRSPTHSQEEPIAQNHKNARALTLPAGGKSPRSHSAAARSIALPKSRLRANSNPEEAAKKAIPARSSNSPCGRPNCLISG